MKLLDWLVMALVSLLWITSTIYLFIHPSEADFATWGTICSVMTGVYHWLNIHDQKYPDACHTQ
jgi:hypothetical protein